MMRHLKIINQSDWLETELQTARCLRHWQEKWWAGSAPDFALSRAEFSSLGKSLHASWLTLSPDTGASPWLALSAPVKGALWPLLLGTSGEDVQPPAGSLLQDLETEAWQDLLGMISDAASHSGDMTHQGHMTSIDSLPAGAVRPYDGVQCVICDSGSLSFCLLIWPEAIGRWLNGERTSGNLEKTPFTRMSRALDRETLRLDVIAGDTTVAAVDLASLAPGQVLRLDRRLDHSFDLVAEGNVRIGRGYLGSLDGHKAVQMARS